LLSIGCDNDLDQAPENIASADSLTDYTGVVNAAYYYQQGANTPMAVMGDFRSDNMLMKEGAWLDWHTYNGNIKSQEEDFFEPLYRNMYKSILSANTVIENSDNDTHVGEAKFLRALSYFKLILTFGDVSVVADAVPSITDFSNYGRQPSSDVYNNVIIPDLEDAIDALDNSIISEGRTSNLAANALLGKVYVHMGDFTSAETYLEVAYNSAASAGVMLETDFANVVSDDSVETIFATQRSSAISDEYNDSEFTIWYGGTEDKALEPLNPDLTAAFDAAGDVDRKAKTINESASAGVKYSGGLDNDWIEIRLSDVILLYAETLNENNSDTADNILGLLDGIRDRAGLTSLSGTISSQSDIRDAILDERRLELAFEGHRWFDLVRTGTVDEEMGQVINSNYYIFPMLDSEISSSSGLIKQNPGY